MASCSHPPTTKAHSPPPNPPYTHKLHNCLFPVSFPFPPRLFSFSLLSSQMYNPHLFFDCAWSHEVGIISPILYIKKPTIREIKLPKVICQLQQCQVYLTLMSMLLQHFNLLTPIPQLFQLTGSTEGTIKWKAPTWRSGTWVLVLGFSDVWLIPLLSALVCYIKWKGSTRHFLYFFHV